MTEGGLRGTAMTEIIKSPIARERFLADPWVRSFLDEQRVIEEAILATAEASEDYESMCSAIRAANNANGKVTRAGKLAYMYQNWETTVMNLAVEVLRHHGVEPVARIHDAFIVRAKRPPRVLDDIAAQWGHRDYLALDCDEVRAWIAPEFKRDLIEADRSGAAHELHIQREERHARTYANRMRTA